MRVHSGLALDKLSMDGRKKKEEEASQLSLILSAYLESFTMTSLLKSSIAFRGTENEFVSDKALGWVNDIFLNYFR